MEMTAYTKSAVAIAVEEGLGRDRYGNTDAFWVFLHKWGMPYEQAKLAAAEYERRINRRAA